MYSLPSHEAAAAKGKTTPPHVALKLVAFFFF